MWRIGEICTSFHVLQVHIQMKILTQEVVLDGTSQTQLCKERR